jgi:hypothetical protein
MSMARIRKNLRLIVLAVVVLTAVTYGAATYQTSSDCGPNGVAQGPDIDWQVLAEP